MVLLAPADGSVHSDAAVMGAVVGAVSPAVIVPLDARLLEEGYGAGGTEYYKCTPPFGGAHGFIQRLSTDRSRRAPCRPG